MPNDNCPDIFRKLRLLAFGIFFLFMAYEMDGWVATLNWVAAGVVIPVAVLSFIMPWAPEGKEK